MSILQDFDSSLHYENIEKAWTKYKIHFFAALVALFAATAGYQFYTQQTIANAKADSKFVFDYIAKKDQAGSQTILELIEKLETTTAIESLTLELAKAYKAEENIAKYVSTLETLTSASTKTVKAISTYMLAEHFVEIDATKALDFINNANISKSAFTFTLVQELKANALIKLEKTAEAKTVLDAILATNPSANIATRVNYKLTQIK